MFSVSSGTGKIRSCERIPESEPRDTPTLENNSPNPINLESMTGTGRCWVRNTSSRHRSWKCQTPDFPFTNRGSSEDSEHLC